jgi:hypothetical protein
VQGVMVLRLFGFCRRGDQSGHPRSCAFSQLASGLECSLGAPFAGITRRQGVAAWRPCLVSAEEIRAISRFGIGMAESGSSSRPGPKVAALVQKNIDTNCAWRRVASGPANQSRFCWAWRRLPSLPCRRFPNLPAVVPGAGLEAGDTAGLESCATQARQSRAKPMPVRGQALGNMDWI